MMSTAVLAAADAATEFSWKTLLTFVGAAVLLAFFSSIGIIARIRERRIEERRQTQGGPPSLDQPGSTRWPDDAGGEPR